MEELKSKQPSVPFCFEFERKGEVQVNGGNDYKVTSIVDSVTHKIVKKEILAISSGDTLFLNCFKAGFQNSYTDVLSIGKYIAFRAGYPKGESSFNYGPMMGAMFGIVGGAIGGAMSGSGNDERFLWVLDSSTNKVEYYDEKTLEGLLENYPDLKEQFKTETYKGIEVTLIKYIKLINNHN